MLVMPSSPQAEYSGTALGDTCGAPFLPLAPTAFPPCYADDGPRLLARAPQSSIDLRAQVKLHSSQIGPEEKDAAGGCRVSYEADAPSRHEEGPVRETCGGGLVLFWRNWAARFVATES